MPINEPTMPKGTPAWKYYETYKKLLALPNKEETRFLIFSYATAARQMEAMQATTNAIEIFEDKNNQSTKMHIQLRIAKMRLSHAEKTIVINPNKNEFERFLFDKIIEQKNSVIENPEKKEQNLFFNNSKIKLSTKNSYARKWAKKYLNCNHHFLRHCRLTDLTKEFGYNSYDLIKVAGWTDITPSVKYISSDVSDLEKRHGL